MEGYRKNKALRKYDCTLIKYVISEQLLYTSSLLF